MGLTIRALILIASVACLACVTHAIAGQATYYNGPYFQSACYSKNDSNTMVVALNPKLFSIKAEACGKMYRVRCTGTLNADVPKPCKEKSVDLLVVDRCPSCKDDQLDLSKEAFALIADPKAAKIKIDYEKI